MSNSCWLSNEPSLIWVCLFLALCVRGFKLRCVLWFPLWAWPQSRKLNVGFRETLYLKPQSSEEDVSLWFTFKLWSNTSHRLSDKGHSCCGKEMSLFKSCELQKKNLLMHVIQPQSPTDSQNKCEQVRLCWVYSEQWSVSDQWKSRWKHDEPHRRTEHTSPPVKNAEHPPALNPCCEWDTSLCFLGQQLLFLPSSHPLPGRNLIKRSYCRDHQKKERKRGIPGRFLGVKLIRHQSSTPALFKHTVYPKIHKRSDFRDHRMNHSEVSSVMFSTQDESHLTPANTDPQRRIPELWGFTSWQADTVTILHCGSHGGHQLNTPGTWILFTFWYFPRSKSNRVLQQALL